MISDGVLRWPHNLEVAGSNPVPATLPNSRRSIEIERLSRVGSGVGFLVAKTVHTVLADWTDPNMPRLTLSLPKYRRHKSGQAVVTLSGTDFYLGPWNSKVSRLEYDRIVGEWIQNGRQLPQGNGCDLAVVEVANA